jgi:phosphatidylserine/phosphatidylglycerophosphate/cardiolipin synthase-like enzyme
MKRWPVFLLLIGVIGLLSACEPLPPEVEAPSPEEIAEVAELLLEDPEVLEANTSGASGSWWEIYFTDPARQNNLDNAAGSVFEALMNTLNSAQVSIDIAAFELDLAPIVDALLNAEVEGIEVRWITDDEHGLEADQEGPGLFEALIDGGVDVISDERSALMHNKFIIIDGWTVWTGSTNLTQNGFFRNNNNAFVLHSTRAAAVFQQEFDEMWAGDFGPRSPATPVEQGFAIDGTEIQILFGAEDEVMDWIIPLVESAQSNIRFMAFSFTHDELGAAVFARALSGVDVAGIFETRASETAFSELTPMYCSNVPVRQDGSPGSMHHKVIVIDAEIVITGSLNFSANANDSNDENVLIVQNAEIAAEYLQEFNRRWLEARDPELDCP